MADVAASLLLLLLGAGAWGRHHLPPVYHNQFAVLVPAGRRHADLVAARHGFTNVGQIGHLPGYFLFEHQHVHKRSSSPSQQHLDKLSTEPEVQWVQQQYEKIRTKRDLPRYTEHTEQKCVCARLESTPCPLFLGRSHVGGPPVNDGDASLGDARRRDVATTAPGNCSVAGKLAVSSPGDVRSCGPAAELIPDDDALWSLQNNMAIPTEETLRLKFMQDTSSASECVATYGFH